jgi:hypothetical protein
MANITVLAGTPSVPGTAYYWKVRVCVCVCV